MRIAPLLAVLLLAGCGEAIRDDHFANDVEEATPAEASITVPAVPVRIGELGASFAACNAVGTPRNVGAGEGLPVRPAPFDSVTESGRIVAGTRFFVCSRSLDQRWFGVVWDESGALGRCGVATPVTTRQNYAGPCRSGWIASAFVKLVGD